MVAIDDAKGQILWMRHFLASQGEPVPVTTIYQDNKSTILLSENGRASSTKHTKHLDVRYFFVTDQKTQGEFKVAYCPTENMLADFITKPLQGTVFRRIQSHILNSPTLMVPVKSTGVCWAMQKKENRTGLNCAEQ